MSEVKEYIEAFNQLCKGWETGADTQLDYPDIQRTWWRDGADSIMVVHSTQSGLVLMVSSTFGGETEYHHFDVIVRVMARLDEKKRREVAA